MGSEWSDTSTDTTPEGARGFLGQFSNGDVTLTLDDLPSHTEITVSFNLFLIRTWDGNDDSPDIWELSVAGGSTLLITTFSNNEEFGKMSELIESMNSMLTKPATKLNRSFSKIRQRVEIVS